MCFVKMTNLSPRRPITITHVWFATNPEVDVVNPDRPLPKTLGLDEQWEAWVPISTLHGAKDVETLAQVIHYDFLAKNTGNVSLTTVHVTDTQDLAGTKLTSGPTCPTAVLAAGASETCTGTYTVTQANLTAGSVADSAVATGTSPTGKTVKSPPRKLTTIKVSQHSALSVKATEAPGSPNPVTAAGQTVTYDFAVANTGNVSLRTVKVTDTQPTTGEVLVSGPTCLTAALAPAATETCTATYKTTKADVAAKVITNTGTATATGPATQAPTAAATVVIPVVVSAPHTTTPAPSVATPTPVPSPAVVPVSVVPLSIITGGGLAPRMSGRPEPWLLFAGAPLLLLGLCLLVVAYRRRRTASM